MQVGTFSGVRSPGIVISSAFEGTSNGNSSLTRERIKDVFPTFLKKELLCSILSGHDVYNAATQNYLCMIHY